MHAASKKFGKDMNTTNTWKARMEKIGFVNVTEEVYKVRRVLFFFLFFYSFLSLLAFVFTPSLSRGDH
jgi:hypothetical protein